MLLQCRLGACTTKSTQAIKKGAALCKMASMKKAVKYRWQPRNSCDGRVNCVASFLGIGTKFTSIVIKIFVTNLPL